MSLSNLIKDVLAGDFSNAEHRIKDFLNSLSPGLQKFVTTIETEEGKILQGLVVTAAQDVLTGGLTTASFVAAAKDVGTKLVSQNITMSQQVVFAALNAEVAAQTPNVSSSAVTPPISASP